MCYITFSSMDLSSKSRDRESSALTVAAWHIGMQVCFVCSCEGLRWRQTHEPLSMLEDEKESLSRCS